MSRGGEREEWLKGLLSRCELRYASVLVRVCENASRFQRKATIKTCRKIVSILKVRESEYRKI